jgi:cell shape-determining protein MreD
MDLTRKGLLNTILLPPLFLVLSKFPIWAKIEMVVVNTRLGFTDKK